MIIQPGVNEFIDLVDVPHSYFGQANKAVTVGAGETGLAFTTSAAGGNVYTDSVSGTDAAGFVNIKTGTSPTANATIATITFNSSYGSASFCTLTSATTSTATVWAITTTSTLLIKSNTALVGTASYAWYYYCLQ